MNDLKARYSTLSDRERQVLQFVTGGLLNKQIAAEMGLSEVTVKVHRHNMMKKLAVQGRCRIWLKWPRLSGSGDDGRSFQAHEK